MKNRKIYLLFIDIFDLFCDFVESEGYWYISISF